MAKITVPPLVLRTTSDSPGHAHGLALGTGSSIDTALENLENEGMRQAQELAGEFRDDQRDNAEWPFAIIDVKLVPAR